MVKMHVPRIVSTHSHPKVAADVLYCLTHSINSFNTQPPEGGCGCRQTFREIFKGVSTHSHPKVATFSFVKTGKPHFCFNTQPPEGGCKTRRTTSKSPFSFNTQPPEGGCLVPSICFLYILGVSTHSHPKVAACAIGD